MSLPQSLTINQPRSPRNLIADAIAWLESGHRVAMLTLVNIEGSAPYPLGTQMLVNEQGDFLGQITGGCAELALAQQAVEVIQSAQSSYQRFGLGSPFFDIQLPCGSGIDVFFDVETTLQEYQAVNKTLTQRKAVQKVYPSPSGELTKTFLPNEKLMLCGQGPIFESLAELALGTGFEVAAVSSRPSKVLDHHGISYADLNGAKEFLAKNCDEFTAFVSLFHEHDLETDLLLAVLESDAFYIGALGSKSTHSQRLKALSDLGADRSSLLKIHGPVGLDINAQTPTQIAVSVLAEIIQHLPKS